VRWIFALRLAGRSTASIARELNEDGVPCPSAHDPERNRHRSGQAWTLRTVAEILANPRYTGRQVWNRQRTEHEGEAKPGSDRPSAKRRWNPRGNWIMSRNTTHPPLVSEHDFVAAQQVKATMTAADGSSRRYQLTGLVRCGLCRRRMVGHWVHGRPGYRCRHGRSSATPARSPDAASPFYVREDRLLAAVAHTADQGRTSVADVANYLRVSGRLVVWSGRGVALETEHGGPP
jgi:hypothetical protein